MILEDMVTYLRGYTALTTISGIPSTVFSAAKIFPIQAPTGTVMPYLIVEVAEGSRGKMAAQSTESNPMIRIMVDAGPNQSVAAGNIMAMAQKALENFRGLMGNTSDVFLTCSEIRGWAGMSGSYRFMMNVNGRYVESRSTP
jgi:hypothetical protein